MDWFARFIEYAHHCVSRPLGFPDCNALWGGVFLVVLCVVGIAVIRLIYRTSAHDEQQAIEDIIAKRRRYASDTQHTPSAEVEPVGPYDSILKKIRDDAAKAKDAFQ